MFSRVLGEVPYDLLLHHYEYALDCAEFGAY